jgi:hypothetical protein
MIYLANVSPENVVDAILESTRKGFKLGDSFKLEYIYTNSQKNDYSREICSIGTAGIIANQVSNGVRANEDNPRFQFSFNDSKWRSYVLLRYG